jgi:hypothetical protein
MYQKKDTSSFVFKSLLRLFFYNTKRQSFFNFYIVAFFVILSNDYIQ